MHSCWQEKEWIESPPWYHLVTISENCLQTMPTYLYVWGRKDNNNRLVLHKDLYEYIPWDRLRADLDRLCQEDVIYLDETSDCIHLEFSGLD